MKRFDTINVIPLIDVMLVLLAIVLMTASFIVKDNLKIDLPETESTQSYIPTKDTTPIYFHIDQHNQLYIDEKAQNMAFTEKFIKSLDKEQPLIIQVDKKAEFGTFVSLIDALKKHELDKLSILTKSKNPSSTQLNTQ